MFKKYSDKEILEGMMVSGYRARQMEGYLFNQYKGLVARGIKDHFLNKIHSLNCYHDAMADFVFFVRKDKFDTEKPIKLLLTTIFDRKCIDQIRKNTNLKNKPTDSIDELLGFSSPDDSPLDNLLKSDMVESIQGQLRKMGDVCQTTISLWAMSYSHKEIATLMPNLKNSNSARTTVHTCLKKLRKNCNGE